jgi:hypothetical protein
MSDTTLKPDALNRVPQTGSVAKAAEPNSALVPNITKDDPAFSLLRRPGAYERYFDILKRAFTALHTIYDFKGSEARLESRVTLEFIERLYTTATALELKYAFQTAEKRPLWIDLATSGLPNTQDMNNFAIDVKQRDKRLLTLPVASALKQLIVDYMFKYHDEPIDFLQQLAERAYFDKIAEDKVFLPFTLSRSALVKQDAQHQHARSYTLSWGCYDYTFNRPYIHLMTFEQNNEDTPLEQHKENYQALLKLIQNEGSRAPDIAILAMAIDDANEMIHPKMIRRVAIGPFYTPLLFEEMPTVREDHQPIQALFENYAAPNDFIVSFTDEIIFSKRQQTSRSLFAPNGRVREVFHIPEHDPLSFARRASVVHKHILVPHSIAQHLTPEMCEQIHEFKGAKVMTYDPQDDYGSQ